MVNQPDDEKRDRAPLFGTWKRFYVVVLANTLFVYLLLVLFSTCAR